MQNRNKGVYFPIKMQYLYLNNTSCILHNRLGATSDFQHYRIIPRLFTLKEVNPHKIVFVFNDR